MEESDQRALVRLAGQGDMLAFRKLYDLYVRRVTCQVGRLLGPGGDVEDVVQEVFVQVHRSLANFREESAFSTWLYRVTWNVAVSHLRRKAPPTVDLPALIQFACERDQWDTLQAREQLRTLYAALDDLPADYREAFILFEIEGMSLQEIAEMTGDTLNTVASRVRRSRERLRALLDRVDEAPQSRQEGGAR
jgi:RNA polymerase sigma-70 factor (ECF subfamily)